MSRPATNPVEIVIFPLDSDDQKRRALFGLLTDDEAQRAARYRFDKHRNRFITGRGSIREILADRGNCSPRAIVFALNDYGKPSLDQPEPMRHMQFNASSSEATGAIAISNGIPLGLDIERIKPDGCRDYDAIVKNEFARDEYLWYRRHAGSERVRIFFEMWTCKEAYLKALGIGLSGKLDGFTISLDGDEPRVGRTDLERGGDSRLSLYRLNIGAGFAACLALPGKASRIDLSRW